MTGLPRHKTHEAGSKNVRDLVSRAWTLLQGGVSHSEIRAVEKSYEQWLLRDAVVRGSGAPIAVNHSCAKLNVVFVASCAERVTLDWRFS